MVIMFLKSAVNLNLCFASILAQTSPPASEEPDVARRPRGRPRKTAIGDAAPSTKREIIKEAEAGRTKNKAPSRDAVDTVAVNMAESKVKFDSEIWSQEEVKVLRKVHMSVPLELHDFWGEISSRYNRSMFDLYGSKAPLRSARECQEIWFEVHARLLNNIYFKPFQLYWVPLYIDA